MMTRRESCSQVYGVKGNMPSYGWTQRESMQHNKIKDQKLPWLKLVKHEVIHF